MDSVQTKRAEEIFNALVGEAKEQRTSLLARRCDGDAELRALVEQLLANDDSGMGRFMREPAIGVRSDQALAAQPPLRIGRYEIVREIGRGGMAIVYEARQDKPRRNVAVKVIRSGFPSAEALRRFGHEADILGQLHHPGLAQIYESGIGVVETAAGHSFEQPFFAMELISGKMLNEHARTAKLSTRQKLELAARACEAVQYAHQNGVIHRDLKPANILVDEHGQPKILDFGVARATGADIHTLTLQTDVGQLIGTVPYMSPEQVAGNSRLVDTRSDVYALGVILYELLSGRLPHDLERLTIPEAARRIRDEPPALLSSLDRAFRGEIETIVTKAIHKDKSRRYQSAVALAGDIRRYLRGDPIDAKRDSAFYLLGKTVRRHRWAAAGAAVFIIGLAAFAGYAGVQADRYERLARQESRAKKQALAAQDKAESVNRFLRTMLAAPDPYRMGRSGVTVKEVLDQAAATVETEFAGQPLVEAQIRLTLGRTYRHLAAPDESREQIEAALAIHRRELGREHPLIANSMVQLALTLNYTGDFEPADDLLRDALAMQRRLSGEEHEAVAATMVDLGQSLSLRGRYDEAERLLRTALAIQKKLLPNPHDATALTLNNLGVLSSRLGRLEEAESLHRAALEMRRRLAPESLGVVQCLSNLAEVIRERGDSKEAESLHREVLALRRLRLPADHPDIAFTLSNLGALLHLRGEIDEAEIMLREAVEIRRNTPGGPHPALGTSLNNLARLLVEKLQYDRAEELQREALDITLAAYGPDHDNVARARINLAELLSRKGEHDKAEDQYRRALRTLRKTLGDEHPTVGVGLNNLAIMLQSLGRSNEAEPLIREAIEIFTLHFGADHANVAHFTNTLGVVLLGLGDDAGAEQAFARALARRRELFGIEHVATAGSMYNLASVQIERAAYADAEPLLRESLRVRRKLQPESHPEIGDSLHMLGLLLVRRAAPGDLESSEPLLRECISLRMEVLRPKHWQITDTRSVLGQCLSRMARFEEAEAMLLGVLDSVRDDPSCPSRVESETKARLVELYENADRPLEAKKWRAKPADWQTSTQPVIRP